MESTSARVLFVAALFAGIAGLVAEAGATFERGLAAGSAVAATETVPVSLESTGKAILAAAAVLLGASMIAARRSMGLHDFFSRPHVWSISIPIPRWLNGSRAPARTANAPAPPPAVAVGRDRVLTTYVSTAPTAPIDDLIASCSAIRLNPPPPPPVEVASTRRSAGRYR